MIKTEEYINLLKAWYELSGVFKITGIEIDNEDILMFDNLRQLYQKFVKKANYQYYYPKIDIQTEIKPYAEDISNFCKQSNIRYKFFPLEKQTHKDGIYVEFFYHNINITKLIDLYPGQKKFNHGSK